jgi:hypothetical protein
MRKGEEGKGLQKRKKAIEKERNRGIHTEVRTDLGQLKRN